MGYKVIVNESKVKFSASHFLLEHFKYARLHGHNYYVSVEISEISDNLDEKYFVVDFMELNAKLKEIVEPLDHYVLSKKITIKHRKISFFFISLLDFRSSTFLLFNY